METTLLTANANIDTRFRPRLPDVRYGKALLECEKDEDGKIGKMKSGS